MKPEERLTSFSLERPKTVLGIALLITLLFALSFLHVRVDTDPENMLRSDQPDRVLYDRVKRDFGLNDMIVVGIVDARGVYRTEALERIARIVDDVIRIPGVITEDIVSLTTSNNAVSMDGLVEIRPVMERVPQDAAAIDRLRREITENRFLNEKIVSADGHAAAIYVPIQGKDQSARIADEIRSILRREALPGQTFHVAGLPVAETTFGREMFVQMAVVAPLAFAGILLLVFWLFREMSYLLPMGLTAALSVIWAMGALIATGHTVHIMSSMIAIFLMPIAILDNVHILTEVSEHYPAAGSRTMALREAMRHLYRPMLVTSITSAVGFASLALSSIPPVRVFGLFVAFGILVAWILTHTLVPALFALDEARGGKRTGASPEARSGRPFAWMDRTLHAIGSFAYRRAVPVLVLAGFLLALGVVGILRLRIDDNPVRWFRPGHPMRVSDDVMNRQFGGTYMATLLLEGEAPEAMHRPEVVRYIDRLQRRVEAEPIVGKTSSVADIVRRLNLVLHENDPQYDTIPDSQESVGQLLFIFQGSGHPGELENFVDREGRQAAIWVQMRGGDNRLMQRVEDAVAGFTRAEPPPAGIRLRWTGLNYINKIWQGLMVQGMLNAVLWDFLVLLALMMIAFRSWSLGLLSMVPLTVAIVFSYGLVGLLGKACDMPIVVCSALSLGLAVDFAIHYFERARAHWKRTGSLDETNRYLSGPPGRAIARNAVVISFGFLPLIVSTLTPYVTVSLFFASLMIASAFATLLILPALLRLVGGRVLR